MFRYLSVFVLLLPFLLSIVGCREPRIPPLETEERFTLRYGLMEDELNLFVAGGAMERRVNIVMNGGLFRISSGYGNKVMEFTSYGDLISAFYNPLQNPAPVLLQNPGGPDTVVNRPAYQFPFNEVGEIAVTADGTLLVEDRVPARVAEFDADLGVVLNRIVARFSADGTQLDYLGQEGIGGTYLPYIKSIETTVGGDIVLITLAPPKTIVFWYDSDGNLLRRIDIAAESYPVLTDVVSTPVLEAVHADREDRRLYLKFDYHTAPAGSATAGLDYLPRIMSRIYWMDIEDGSYAGFVDVPRDVEQDAGVGGTRESVEYQYEFLGTARGEHLFLLSQRSMKTSQLLILNANGRVVRRRELNIDYGTVVFRDLSIDDSGILSGLLAGRDDARVVWWRTDNLFRAGRQ